MSKTRKESAGPLISTEPSAAKLPTSILRVLEDTAKLFDSPVDAFRLLIARAFVKKSEWHLRLLPGGSSVGLQRFTQAMFQLWRRRKKYGTPSPTSILSDALDDGPDHGYGGGGNPRYPTMAEQENRRDPEGRYEAYFGKWYRDDR